MLDNAADAGARGYVPPAKAQNTHLHGAHGNICTCVTRGNSDMMNANVLIISARPEIQVGITHCNQLRRFSSRNSSALGDAQNVALSGT